MLTTRPRDGGEREPVHGFDGSVHVGVAPPMDDAQLNAVDPVTSTTATSKKRQHPPVCNALDSSDFASSNDGAKRLKVDTALAASAIEPKPTDDSTVATTPASASLVKAVAEDHMTKVPATVSKSNGAQTTAAVATAPASASSRAAVTVHAPCTPTSSGPDKHRISRYVVYGSYSQLMTEEERKAAPKDHTHKWKLFCQGYGNQDISTWCSSVVFRLHESFAEPRRVVLEPPYEIHETGWGEFECGIELHFREPRVKPVSFFHLLKLYPLEQGATTTASAHEPVVASSEPVLYERFDEVVFTVHTGSALGEILQSEPMLSTCPPCVESKFVDDQIETELAALAAAKNSIQEQIEGLSARKITLLSDISDLKILISKLEREAAAESRVSVTAGSTPVKA